MEKKIIITAKLIELADVPLKCEFCRMIIKKQAVYKGGDK